MTICERVGRERSRALCRLRLPERRMGRRPTVLTAAEVRASLTEGKAKP